MQILPRTNSPSDLNPLLLNFCGEKGGRDKIIHRKVLIVQKGICILWKITDDHLESLSMCLSQGATTSVNCICPPGTVLPDYLSQLAQRGHPHWKRPLFHPQRLLSERPERGRPQSHQLQNSPIVTDAINRNLHSSQCESEVFTLCQRKLLCIGAEQMLNCKDRRLHAAFVFFFSWAQVFQLWISCSLYTVTHCTTQLCDSYQPQSKQTDV